MDNRKLILIALIAGILSEVAIKKEILLHTPEKVEVYRFIQVSNYAVSGFSDTSGSSVVSGLVETL